MVFSIGAMPTSASEILPVEASFTDLNSMEKNLDTDGDGVVDIIEMSYGSDHQKADTDDDGVPDYIELYVTHTDVFSPDSELDSDDDGLTNAQEVLHGTRAGDRDTDSDDLSDGDEVNTLRTDPLVADSDGDGVDDGVEVELELNPTISRSDGVVMDIDTAVARSYFGDLQTDIMTALDESTVSVLATGDDSDYDGRNNTLDTYPNNNNFGAILHTAYNGEEYTSDVAYKMDYTWFFKANTTYNPDLAVVSSLFAANVYPNNYLSINAGGYLALTSGSNSMGRVMGFHGLSGIVTYSLTNSDNHVTDMIVGHREVTYNGVTKNVVCVVIRGTNATLKEWSSNFDIGTTTDSHAEWKNESNHKGFDITAYRLSARLDDYIETYLDGESYVLWITGHSRGGALANLLAAKRLDELETVYAYAFATPNTTVSSLATHNRYKCIFNILNGDDYITDLPLTGWGFKRYGVDKKSYISNNESKWKALTGYTYDYDEIGKGEVLDAMFEISASRNNCYVEHAGVDGYVEKSYSTAEKRQSQYSSTIQTYTSNTVGTYRAIFITEADLYKFRIYQQPAFLMQTLAGIMGGAMDATTYATLDVAPYLEEAKWGIAFAYAGGMTHPHYVESYYLLATLLS